MSEQAGLAKGALGTLESAVMGVAGTAPAFSVAVTTATIVAAVGVLSVGSILYCGLIMFGLMLAFNLGAVGFWWFRWKLLCVAGLSVYHMWMGAYAKRLAAGERILSSRTLRLLNEVPGIAAIVIIILVVVKPFMGA